MKKYTKKTIEFYDKHIEVYKKRGAIVLKSKINKFIKLLKGPKVLDVGCGPGHDTAYFTKKGFDCFGIDLSKKMIEYAKKNYRGKFKVMDFMDLRFKLNSFDGIWCSSVLTHVDKKDLDKVLKSFLRILKKEGILGIIVSKTYRRIRKKGDARIFIMFKRGEIEKILAKNSLKIIYTNIFTYSNLRWIFIISQKEKGAAYKTDSSL